ncbi:hypothetical protein K456DRAFT_1765521 [Colletotrichum gloeosporioides 23]|nr:hypothetical protein K456DRAFT_1765521 [Colletotrichum gloeosporioides 23]
MSQLQPATVEAPAAPAATVQQPAPAHDRSTIVAATADASPAPATELPADVRNVGQTTTTPPVEQQKGADQKPAPPTIQGVTPLHMLGDKPQPIDCPFCMRRTMTIVDTEGTSMQMLAGALCCLLCVCLTCVPCIAGWCEDTHYSCGNCHKRVATRPYDGPIQVFGPHGQMFPMVPSQYEPMAPPVAEQQSPPVYK